MQYIYLHGFASSPASSKATYFRERFAERGIALDVPALDGGRFEELTITGQLGVIDAVAGGGELALIGSSLGGYLAALYASSHPEVRRVALMAPAFCFPRRWEYELGPGVFEQWKRTGQMRVFHYGDGLEREIGFRLIEDGLRYEDYPKLDVPALLLHGERDDVVPIDYSREFVRRQGPTARLVEYPSDHALKNVLPAMWDEVDRFLFQETE